jgi:hypothetical protein
MRYAAIIESQSGTCHLTFPDAPGYAITAKVANSLLSRIEDRLFEALHQHVVSTGDLPLPAHTGGLLIAVTPLHVARLAVLRGVLQRGASTPEAVASLLNEHTTDAAELLDSGEFVMPHTLFQNLEELGIQLSFEDSESEGPRPMRTSRPKKRAKRKPVAA